MYIAEFASSRNVDSQAVQKYVNRHEEEFKNHVFKNGKYLNLDDEAIKILDKTYPIPKPVQIINGVDPNEYENLQKQLISAKDLVIALKDQIQAQTEKISVGESAKLLLEEKKNQVSELKSELKEQKSKLESDIDELKRKNEELQNQLQAEQSKPWWKKLRGK